MALPDDSVCDLGFRCHFNHARRRDRIVPVRGTVMGDKDAIKQLQEKIRKAVGFQEKVKEVSAAAVAEVEESEREER